MYRCQVTNKISKPGEKLNKIIVSTREKIYTQKIWEDDELVEIEIGRGWEIVKEINATDEGVRVYNRMVEDGTVGDLLRKL
jgi:hypothetical protein